VSFLLNEDDAIRESASHVLDGRFFFVYSRSNKFFEYVS